MEAYGVSLAEGVDVEESECLVGFQELEAGDLAWAGWSMVSQELGTGGKRASTELQELEFTPLTLDDLAEDAGGHFARHWVALRQVTERCTNSQLRRGYLTLLSWGNKCPVKLHRVPACGLDGTDRDGRDLGRGRETQAP